jgi:hypothetical protein
MTPKHRSIVREGWQAIGQKGSATNANPFSKTGVVAGVLQDWIAQNYPIEAAEMRLEHNPDGLTMDAQCVVDGTLKPDEASEEVWQNLFKYNAKYARQLIAQQKADVDQRIDSGKATLADMIQLEESGDPRAEQLKSQQDAAKAKRQKDQAVADAALQMQSAEQARNQLKAEAIAAGRF